MTEIRYTQQFDIKTALKIIRHISSGIYRDLGGSLKELVSNSFDAQATEVSIWSGSPRFDTIVVEDNGNGITEEALRKAFENVGLSTKVTHPEWYESPRKRPLIGRFGIGFLSSAHISKDILMRTFADASKPGLQVHMDLEPYFRYMNSVDTSDTYQFGSVEYTAIPNPKHVKGTAIELRHVRGGDFHEVISADGADYVAWPASGERAEPDGQIMRDFVSKLQTEEVHALPSLCGRNQLLWHLGMTTPVRYVPGGPIAPEHLRGEVGRIVNRLQTLAENFDFRVWFDGVELRKPLLLPTPKVARAETEDSDVGQIDDYQTWPIRISTVATNGHKVRAEGYLFFQPYRVIPVESRGLLPRVDGVGVGATLDNTFLSDLKAESPLFRVQVSGELYIIEGLADALDLDRSGFLQVDAEFRTLLKDVGEQIYGFVREAAKIRKARHERIKRGKSERDRDDRIQTLTQMLNRVSLEYQIIPTNQPALDRMSKTDYSEKAAYPAGTPRLVISYKEGTARVDLDVEDPGWSALVALMDRLLAECSNSRELRRRFAEGLREIDRLDD